ncbi:rna-directed dna polymerase from mobile element jockey-like [Limosa lapponica baueri]|uniref:Rna-directed dna polymerase from mobile element jockey-like n=1 Tax=Limosa lapponica baueri TaxID=1758121 RepID=A0A2I0TIP2_LIMLA|nr:rna-directed dna polymerase from mobile element jockey-like [Limosa lapponica baueri]
MGNKQEELEATVHQENYDVVAITERWWDDSHDWSAALAANSSEETGKEGEEQTEEVPVDWRLANVMPIYKKGQKDNLGTYRPVSLTSVPGKVMEQIILSAIMGHMKDNQVTRPSQHGFMKGRSCLTNLISCYDKVTHLVDEGKAVDVIYLDFSKAFDMVSHSIFLEKLTAHGLDGSTLLWIKKWLEARPKELW